MTNPDTRQKDDDAIILHRGCELDEGYYTLNRTPRKLRAAYQNTRVSRKNLIYSNFIFETVLYLLMINFVKVYINSHLFSLQMMEVLEIMLIIVEDQISILRLQTTRLYPFPRL